MQLLMMWNGMAGKFQNLSRSHRRLLERLVQHESKDRTPRTAAHQWEIVFQRGSHIKLLHPQRGTYMFGFHDKEELGPKMLSKIAKYTGLTPEDL